MPILMRKARRGSMAQVFVLGIQKAGTTAIAALLARATGKSLTSDFMRHDKDMQFRLRLLSGDTPFDGFIKRNERYLSKAIIKDPNLSFFYEELVHHFPDAKFVFISRDPRDNIRSTLDWMKLPGDLDDLGAPFDQHPWKYESWRMIIQGRYPAVSGRNYIERLANRWNLAADNYLRNRDRITLIRYEDFSKDKVSAIMDLARQVGLEPAHDFEEHIHFQYQPRGNRQVTWPEFFGDDNLRLIEAVCGPRMRALDYLPAATA